MPAGIFISYRRQDALEAARAIYERLRAEFGPSNVFIDLEGLDYGEDFIESLDRQLQHCQVLLALIGPQWLAALDGHGGRRLDDENDFVRIELRTALQRGIRVVPVLLNGAVMLRTADLPADLQPLLRRQALELDFRRFDGDVARLVGALERIRSLHSPGPPPETELLKVIWREMLLARSSSEIQDLLYRTEEYLHSHPESAEGKLLRGKLLNAKVHASDRAYSCAPESDRSYSTAPDRASPRSTSVPAVIYVGVLLGALGIIGVLAKLFGVI